jgi:hypothetical protein
MIYSHKIEDNPPEQGGSHKETPKIYKIIQKKVIVSEKI